MCATPTRVFFVLGGCYRLRVKRLLCILCLTACTGSIAEPPEKNLPPTQPLEDAKAPRIGMRRLTALQFDNALISLLDDDSRPGRALLPEDARTPFDNDYSRQRVSTSLIDGVELLAIEATERLLGDTERRDRIVGCTPSGTSDRDCLKTFVERFGRKAYRDPLSEDDVSFFLDGDGEFLGALHYAAECEDFYEGVGTVVQMMLQDPRFLYRFEIGTPVEDEPDVIQLTNFEIATRMSFFLTNDIPDATLLDLAEEGELADPEVRVREALRLLEKPAALERWSHFHAMWFGYEKLIPGDDLGLSMRTETEALFKKVIFDENRAWQDIFRLNESYVNDTLADNYGMDSPGAAFDWVPYKTTKRRGLFSHGTFLSIGAKMGDTSPVQRGVAIQVKAFCRTIDPPPPEVNVDEPPESDALCKEERYAMHSEGGCAGCHEAMDPVGFGLENYDNFGRFRTHEIDIADTEEDESTCEISGEGYLAGVGAFSGPGELAELGLSSGLLRDCFLGNMRRYVVGRSILDVEDSIAIDNLAATLGDGDFTLVDLVSEIVRDATFVYGTQETL